MCEFYKGGEDSVVRQYESEEERCGCVHTDDEVLGAVEIRDAIAEPEPQSESGSSGASVRAGVIRSRTFCPERESEPEPRKTGGSG